MSQQAPNHQSTENQASENQANPTGKPQVAVVRIPKWFPILPYFLSAVFYLSAFFAILAPLPLLLFYLRRGRNQTWLAALTNSVIVGFFTGQVGLAFYFIFVVTLALILSECLRAKWKIEKSVAVTLLSMTLVGVLINWGSHRYLGVSLGHEIKGQILGVMDYITQSVSQNGAPVGEQSSLVAPSMPPEEIQDWKQTILIQLPSALAIFGLILVWANLVILLRVNAGGVRDWVGLPVQFLKRWKAPEYLVWPTIVAGFFLVYDAGLASTVALNVFKFLMAIYVIQGLSILSYLFDLWSFKGIVRFLSFFMAVFFMMPVVLSLGFFDLWFDFRGKLKSKENKE